MAIEAAINLFSIHQELGEDYFGTLEKIASAGYTNVELIGFNMKTYKRYIDEIPAVKLQEKLKELGLTVISAHEMSNPASPITAHDWDSVMAYYEQLYCHSIVLPSVFIKDLDETLRAAEQMNHVGKRLQENGFTFYLHNHAHEFKPITAEQTLFDVLIENTDPAYVKFELDLVWVLRAGLDPVQVLNKLADRCDIIHQKDISKETAYPINLFEAMKRDGEQELSNFEIYQKYTVPEDHADLGTGIFDFDTTYDQIKDSGNVRYAVVENEGASQNKLQSLASDLQVLKQYI